MARDALDQLRNEQETFERALAGAHDSFWWRAFMKAVSERRLQFMETLATQHQDQRIEDTLRGQISELTWIQALDRYGETHRRGEDHGRNQASG